MNKWLSYGAVFPLPVNINFNFSILQFRGFAIVFFTVSFDFLCNQVYGILFCVVLFVFFIHCMCVCVIFLSWRECKQFWMIAFPIILFYFTLLLYLFRYEFCSLILCNIFHLKIETFEIEENNSFLISFFFPW